MENSLNMNMTGGIFKSMFGSIFAAIIFLILIIFSGRILNLINKAGYKSNSNLEDAHKWAAWAVGISTTGLIVALIVIVMQFGI